MITQEASDKLLTPFKDAQILQVTKKGTNLSYINHATIIRRIIEVDPSFELQTVKDSHGNPVIEYCANSGTPISMLVELTINGVRREGYGSYDPPVKAEIKEKLKTGEIKWSGLMDPDATKKMFSDAVSVVASRFGVGIQLWDKSDNNKSFEQSEGAEEATKRVEIINRIKKLATENSDLVPLIPQLTNGLKLADCDINTIETIEQELIKALKTKG